MATKIRKDQFQKLFSRMLEIHREIVFAASGIETNIQQTMGGKILHQHILIDKELIRKNREFCQLSPRHFLVEVYENDSIREFVKTNIEYLLRNYRTFISPMRTHFGRNWVSKLYKSIMEVKQAFISYSFENKELTIVQTKVISVNKVDSDFSHLRTTGTIYYFNNIET